MNSDLPGAFTAQPANTEVMLFQMIEIDAFSLDQRQATPFSWTLFPALMAQMGCGSIFRIRHRFVKNFRTPI